jgi:hypothetical protein
MPVFGAPAIGEKWALVFVGNAPQLYQGFVSDLMDGDEIVDLK